jgi:chromosome partitioning protein
MARALSPPGRVCAPVLAVRRSPLGALSWHAASEQLMGKLIAVGNLKGGTGKSTIAVNLACALRDTDRTVALVDADPQGSATDWHAGGGLPVLVESLPLSGQREAQRWVARVLSLKAGADYVVVDLPPQADSGIASALLLADLLLVPVSPSGVDLRATGRALDLLRRARAVRGGVKPAAMLVPSRVDRRTVIGQHAHSTLARFGLQVGPEICQRSAHVNAFAAGTWVGAFAPGSPAHREIRVLKDRVEELLEDVRRAAFAAGPSLHPQPMPAMPGYQRGDMASLGATAGLAGS